jgi:16S rRNA (cytosine1402-N4)-methyltransferase
VIHQPIMLAETLRCLAPRPGNLAVDCTLGGGALARAILDRIQPGGRLIGLDLDAAELARTELQLRREGWEPPTFVARHRSFAALSQLLGAEGLAAADLIVADLGVSTMQIEDPDRGFSYKLPGPLDMRMDRTRGETASQLLARVGEDDLAAILTENADEPYAGLIASLIMGQDGRTKQDGPEGADRAKRQLPATTHALERIVRSGLTAACPDLPKADVKMSVRRTFQALRIAVNRELAALDALLAALPQCLAPGGRVAILTFHSGEDRRVEHAFREGAREGVYAGGADEVIRSTKEETYSNRRAQAAKLRWAVRR